MPIPKAAIDKYLNRQLPSLSWMKEMAPLEVEYDLSFVKPPLKTRVPLRIDQKIVLLAALAEKSLAILSDLGFGKTAISLELIQYYFDHGFIRRAFVFVPTDEVGEGWQDEIKQWGFDIPTIRLAGSSKHKWDQIKEFGNGLIIGTYIGIAAMVSKLVLQVPHVWNRHHKDAPADVRYIGRGTIAGNPFEIGVDGDRDECCDKYEAMVEADPELKAALIKYCAGRDLLCSCKPARCHGDYLVRISNKVKRKREIVPRAILGITDQVDMVVMDQSTKVGNTESLSYQVCADFASGAQILLALAGRAFGRDPFLLWSQFFLIDRGIALGRSPGMFREAFWRRKNSPWGVEWIFRKRREPELAKCIAASSLRYAIEECVDLPPKVSIIKECAFPTENWEYYDTVLEELMASKGNYREVQNSFLRMRQISSGFVGFKDDDTDEKAQIEFEKNPKMDLLLELVDEVPDDRKMVIFYEYTWSGARICQELTKAGHKFGWLWAGTKNWTEIKTAFNGDPDFRIIVAQWRKGSMGLNLQAASYLFFYESPVSMIDRDECEGRIYRPGQKHKSVIYDLVVKDSVDANILEFHKEGRSLFKALVEDPATVIGRRRK